MTKNDARINIMQGNNCIQKRLFVVIIFAAWQFVVIHLLGWWWFVRLSPPLAAAGLPLPPPPLSPPPPPFLLLLLNPMSPKFAIPANLGPKARVWQSLTTLRVTTYIRLNCRCMWSLQPRNSFDGTSQSLVTGFVNYPHIQVLASRYLLGTYK